MSLSIRKDTDAYKATQVGKVAGLGVATAHLIKNKEDIFVNTIKSSAEQFGSKKYGIAGAVIAASVSLIVGTGLGAAIGKLVGTISDNIKFKKAIDNLDKSAPKIPFTAPVFDDITKKSV